MDNDILETLIFKTAMADKSAFKELYELTSGKLYAIALGMLTTRELAEEAIQDAYIKIWHNASFYNADQGQVMSWLISIVRYRCLDILRYRKVRPEHTVETFPEGMADVYHLNIDNSAKRLNVCIEQLEQQQRQAIHLAYFNGLTHSEVTDHMSSNLGTVKSWIRRGLEHLQRCLS